MQLIAEKCFGANMQQPRCQSEAGIDAKSYGSGRVQTAWFCNMAA